MQNIAYYATVFVYQPRNHSVVSVSLIYQVFGGAMQAQQILLWSGHGWPCSGGVLVLKSFYFWAFPVLFENSDCIMHFA